MLTIRQARPTDCDAMCNAQRDAILQHYSASHGADAERWAASVDRGLCERRLASGMTIVVEESNALLGFAQFDTGNGAIDICVVPEAEKRAIASALLAVVEAEARNLGLDVLRLSAMLSAERLYLPAGYVVAGGGEMTLGHEAVLPCIIMEKRVQYSEHRPERRRSLARGGGEG